MQTFDSIALTAVRAELKDLLGIRLERVHQPSAEEILFHFRKTKLFFSTRLNFNRVHLTGRSYENPAVPPSFCMLLRKHLEGTKLVGLRQDGLERVLWFSFEGYDELGDLNQKHFVAEITGKHANLILLDRGEKILGALRVVTPEMSSARQILPGYPYAPPPPFAGKADPLTASSDALISALAEDGSLGSVLNKRFMGLSKVAIAQLLSAASLEPSRPADSLEGPEIRRLQMTWERGMHALKEGWFEPRLEAGPSWEYNLWYFGENPPIEKSVSQLFDRYYGGIESEARLETRKRRLLSEVEDRLEKKLSLKAKLEEGLEEADEADRFRLWGELLQIYAREIRPGAEQAVLPDYEEHPVEIPLDPSSTPIENAQKFFKRYQKSKAVRLHNQRLLEELNGEISYLESILASIQFATEKRELEEIHEEVTGKSQPVIRGRPKPVDSEPLKFSSRDGYEILVGKNNRQNDRLTRDAAPGDWWFHAQYIPGSHVIVRSKGESELPATTLVDAAGLAAFYSRARESTKVPVVYLRRKGVKKPPGSKPGFVIYSNEKVALVPPWSGS